MVVLPAGVDANGVQVEGRRPRASRGRLTVRA
jgi:hypothetical protein